MSVALPACPKIDELAQVMGLGPEAAMQKFLRDNPDPVQRKKCAAGARARVLLGSCPKTHKEFLSGVTRWARFARNVLGLEGQEFPPSVEGLLAWSEMFRVAGTFQNYVGHVSLACQILGLPSEACRSPEIQRARRAIEKLGGQLARNSCLMHRLSLQVLSADASLDLSGSTIWKSWCRKRKLPKMSQHSSQRCSSWLHTLSC